MTQLLAAFFFVVFVSTQVSAQNSKGGGCLNPGVKTKDDSKKRAKNFLSFNSLSFKQKSLLSTFFGKMPTQQEFSNWTVQHNDQAATFMSLTFALAKADLLISDKDRVTALEMVDNLTEIRGVRFIASLNLPLLNAWMQAGSKYVLHHVDNKDEAGQVTFANHHQRGGGLHCGYDIQGFTHYQKTPYIHWNVNLEDGSSDIHLDGNQPWYIGFIPNLEHLDYTNSDVRAWFDNFLKKYGDPGFSVSEDQTPPLVSFKFR